MTFAPLPATACWRHRGARSGFEVAYFRAGPRLPDEGGGQRYRYAAPAFGFTSTLIYDESGLVLDYPGIAVRAR